MNLASLILPRPGNRRKIVNTTQPLPARVGHGVCGVGRVNVPGVCSAGLERVPGEEKYINYLGTHQKLEQKRVCCERHQTTMLSQNDLPVIHLIMASCPRE
jgi:hypothetical protein